MLAVRPDVPLSVKEYMEAVKAIKGGQFISRLNPEWQKFAASHYGSPFFALHSLAYEYVNRLEASVLFSDYDAIYSGESGRWLSLYAKALNWGGKYSFTICTAARPKSRRPLKPLLFQLSQQILLKKWDKHLHDLDVPPDVVVLPISGNADFIKSIANAICGERSAKKYLLGCDAYAEALLFKSFFESLNCYCGGIVGYEASPGVQRPYGKCAWWLSVEPPQFPISLVPEIESEYLQAYEVMCKSITYEGRGDEEKSALSYAVRVLLDIEDESISAVQVNSISGIDLATGRRYFKHQDEYSWEDSRISKDVLSMAPEFDAAEPNDRDRLDLILWLGKVLFEHKNPSSILSTNSVVGPDEVSDSVGLNDAGEQETSVPSSVVDLPDTAHIGNDSGSEISDFKSESVILARPRLARVAGPVNVLALAARLGGSKHGPDEAFEAAQDVISRWLGKKGLPAQSFATSSQFESSDGEVVIESDGGAIWAMRFDDRKSMNQGSIWRVEATLLRNPTPAFSLRLIQVRSSEDSPPPPLSGVPQFVVNIAKQIGLEDSGTRLSDSALRIAGPSQAPWLARLLLNSDRMQPVIVISGKVDASADRLAKRLAGVSHVICIDDYICNQLTAVFGKDLSISGRAIRLYRPGFNRNSDTFDHPAWSLAGPMLPKWLANDIFEQACAISLEIEDLDERAPSFQTIRKILSEYRSAASDRRIEQVRAEADKIASTSEEKISRLIDVVVELDAALKEQKDQARQYMDINQQLENELQATRRERNDALEEIRRLKYQYSSQWSSPTDAELSKVDDEVHYPDTWDDLETWVEVYGQGRLFLHPSAIKAAKESPYRDIPFAYKALDYLVRFYVPMRTRKPDDNQPYIDSQKMLASLGLELSKVGTAVDDKRYKNEYRRQYKGRDVWLDDHLKWGVGFDPETLFRLYFYYDEEDFVVVVGHMPTHLTNRITHTG